MSLFRIKRHFLIICLMLLASISVLDAKTCKQRVFNIKISEKVSTNEILNQLSDLCDFSVISQDQNTSVLLDAPISGINIKNMTLNDIFDLLIDSKGLNYDYKNGLLKISALATKTFRLDYITSVREGNAVTKASVDSAPVQVSGGGGGGGGAPGDNNSESDNIIKTTEKFDFWATLERDIKAILNNGSESIIAPDPIINSNAGLITVTGAKTQLKRVNDYIEDLKKRLNKQVLIDVNIISVELRNDYTQGVDWSKFQLGFNSFLNNDENTLTGYSWGNRNAGRDSFKASDANGAWTIGANVNFNVQGMINFLETKGKTKIISSPKIMTLNNQQALITVGDNINYRVQQESTSDNAANARTSTSYSQYSIFIGILLNLLPEVSDDNKIILRINPSLSNFKYEQDNARQENAAPRVIAPDTLQKKLSTVVRVNSGDTIILGGLIGESKGKDNSKVPLFGDLPLLGNFFKSTRDKISTTELIFVITPHVVDNSSDFSVKQSLKDLGYSGSIYE